MLTLGKDSELALEASANSLIVNALTRGAPPTLPAPIVGEVKAAHATVIAGASQAAAAWASALGPFNIQVKSTAVLIHSAPKVRFTDLITGKSEYRELGDLLIVIDHLTGPLITDRRAILVQAKLTEPKGHIALGPSGEAQRNLYLRWPKFTMPAGYLPYPRDLNDPTCKGLPDNGCCFGGIDLHAPQRDWKQIRTMQSMNTYNQPRLGSFLMRMACGRAGREAIAKGSDPWSSLVDELLQVTSSSSFPKKGGAPRSMATLSLVVGPGDGLRHSESLVTFDIDSPPPDQTSEGVEASEPPRGISTIHIVLSGATELG